MKNTSKSSRKPIPISFEEAMDSNTTHNTLAICVYDEQCIGGMAKVIKIIKSLDNAIYEAYAVIHNKSVKAHLHIGIRGVNGSFKVKTMLDMLNIHFREEDEILVGHRALETLGSFAGYLKYLTHTDADSISAHKDPYGLEEFVTNMDRVKFENLINFKIPKAKLTKNQILALHCSEAEQAGYDLWNYDKWMEKNNIEFIENGYHKTQREEIRNFFFRGRQRRIDDVGYIPQLVIYMDISTVYNKHIIDIDDANRITKQALSDIGISTIYDRDDLEKGDVETAIIRHQRGHAINVYNIREGWHTSNDYQHIYNGSSMLIRDHLDYSNSVVSNGDAVEAWTYKILITTYYDSGVSCNKNKTYFYCKIDEIDKVLDLKDVAEPRANDNVNSEKDRIELWIKFREAFNKRCKDFKKKEPRKKVDYSTILGKVI